MGSGENHMLIGCWSVSPMFSQHCCTRLRPALLQVSPELLPWDLDKSRRAGWQVLGRPCVGWEEITPLIHILAGGLEHLLCFHISGIVTPTDFHIFQRGRSTTNQYRNSCTHVVRIPMMSLDDHISYLPGFAHGSRIERGVTHDAVTGGNSTYQWNIFHFRWSTESLQSAHI